MSEGTSKARRLRPSPSIIISIFALVIAMSSGAYAAVTIAEKNSVVSKSIKNSHVKTKDVATAIEEQDHGRTGQLREIVDGQVGSSDDRSTAPVGAVVDVRSRSARRR